jgi:hypothetical protein
MGIVFLRPCGADTVTRVSVRSEGSLHYRLIVAHNHIEAWRYSRRMVAAVLHTLCSQQSSQYPYPARGWATAIRGHIDEPELARIWRGARQDPHFVGSTTVIVAARAAGALAINFVGPISFFGSTKLGFVGPTKLIIGDSSRPRRPGPQ